jgi:hypothetical protein
MKRSPWKLEVKSWKLKVPLFGFCLISFAQFVFLCNPLQHFSRKISRLESGFAKKKMKTYFYDLSKYFTKKGKEEKLSITYFCCSGLCLWDQYIFLQEVSEFEKLKLQIMSTVTPDLMTTFE